LKREHKLLLGGLAAGLLVYALYKYRRVGAQPSVPAPQPQVQPAPAPQPVQPQPLPSVKELYAPTYYTVEKTFPVKRYEGPGFLIVQPSGQLTPEDVERLKRLEPTTRQYILYPSPPVPVIPRYMAE
jgi:hypothetical protein